MNSRPRIVAGIAMASLCLALAPRSLNASAQAAHVPASSKAYNGTHTVYGSKCKSSPAQKGTLTFSDTQFPANLNVYTGGTGIAEAEQTALTQSTLWTYNNHVRLIPGLASEIPSLQNGGISKDGKTYTIHLKPGLRWSNGQPLIAADVAFSWHINTQKATGPYCLAACDVIQSAKVANKLTVVFHLKHASGPALTDAFTFPIWPYVWTGGWAKGAVKTATKKLTSVNYNFDGPAYPFSGPYEPIKFVAGSRIEYRPNKYYRVMNCGAQLHRLIFVGYPDRTSLIAAAAAHQTDATADFQPTDPATDLASIRSHAGVYSYGVLAALGPQVFTFNDDPAFDGRPNPAHNTKFRQALALATDRLAVAKVLEGNTALAKSMLAWNFMTTSKSVTAPFGDRKIVGVWDPLAKHFTTSPGKGSALADAKRLMNQTPWKGGVSLVGLTTCNNAGRAAAFNLVKKEWARIGVKLSWSCSGTIFDTWSTNGDLPHGRFQVSLHGYVGGSPDPDAWRGDLSYRFCPRVPGKQGSDNDGAFECINDPVLERQWAIESHTPNVGVRRAAFKQIQLRMAQQGYWQPIAYESVISTHDGHVANFHDSPVGPIDWNAYDWAYHK